MAAAGEGAGMGDSAEQRARQARAQAYALAIEAINPADPELFRTDTLWPYFARLREEAPVHRAVDPHYGPYWSVTRYDDIVAVDTDHRTFSAAPAPDTPRGPPPPSAASTARRTARPRNHRVCAVFIVAPIRTGARDARPG